MHMLNKNQIEQNRAEFLKLLAEVNIEGARIQELVEFLDNGDFFTAPASTMYHNNYEGGLCEHSLNVYKNLGEIKKLLKPICSYNPNTTLQEISQELKSWKGAVKKCLRKI